MKPYTPALYHYEFGVIFRADTPEELDAAIEQYKNPKSIKEAPVKRNPRRR